MNKLYIMMGLPASGKSTFIKTHYNPNKDSHISRDDIRLSILQDNEEYFSKENIVYNEFIKRIDEAMAQDHGDVFADATHLNAASRRKLLKSLKSNPQDVECIWMDTPIKECFKRNEKRRGTRSYVPRGQIRRMGIQMTKPQLEEGFNKIYIVEPNKPIQIIEREGDN